MLSFPLYLHICLHLHMYKHAVFWNTLTLSDYAQAGCAYEHNNAALAQIALCE